jgi:hypothetical protein
MNPLVVFALSASVVGGHTHNCILDGNIIRFMDFTALTIKVFDLEYEYSTVQSSTSMQKTEI